MSVFGFCRCWICVAAALFVWSAVSAEAVIEEGHESAVSSVVSGTVSDVGPDVDGTTATGSVPERVILMTGDRNGVADEVMAVIYDTKGLHFHDPSAPRFLFVDREGNTALGIGGYVEVTGMYDFDGAIDCNGFVTEMIAVPSSRGLRNRLKFDAAESRLFLRLVRKTGLGVLTAYVENSFSNGNGGFGFSMKAAYLKLGNVQAGLSRSLFVDPTAGGPTIDYQGPCGGLTGRNVGVNYTAALHHGFGVGVSVEMPTGSYTLGEHAEDLSQRVPDIPVYVQYGWGDGDSHVRLSGIFRDLSYRDLVSGCNRLTPGWGVQLSGKLGVADLLTVYYDGVYGRGIGRYINDLSGYGYDLLPGKTDGRLIAPHSLSMSVGVQFNITGDWFVSGNYSFNRLYNQESLGQTGYRRADYLAVNMFYTCLDDLQLGVEYLHGGRHDMSGDCGSANRILAMAKYSF